jgi:hypothetical protein
MRMYLPPRLFAGAFTVLALVGPASGQAPPSATAPAPVPSVPPPTPRDRANEMVPERVAPDAGAPGRPAPSTPIPPAGGAGQNGATPKQL